MVKTPEPELILLLFLIPLILAGCFIFRRRSRTVLFGILFVLAHCYLDFRKCCGTGPMSHKRTERMQEQGN